MYGKILELREFMYERSTGIILLQETYCRPSKSLKIPDYVKIRNDFTKSNSPRIIRITAICIKNNVNCLLVLPLHLTLSML